VLIGGLTLQGGMEAALARTEGDAVAQSLIKGEDELGTMTGREFIPRSETTEAGARKALANQAYPELQNFSVKVPPDLAENGNPLSNGSGGASNVEYLSKAEKGKLGEAAARRTLARAGYKELPARLSRNQGMDGVFVKFRQDGSVQDIIVTESKYSSSGRAYLAKTQSKGVQLSEQWIDQTIEQMAKSGESKVRATGRLLRSNRDLVRIKANLLRPSGISQWKQIKLPETSNGQ